MRKIVPRAMRREAKQELNDLCQNSNSVFHFLARMKKEGGRCLGGGERWWVLLKKTEKYLEGTHGKDYEWDHMVGTDVVEGLMEKVTRNEIVESMQKMKSESATGPFEVSMEMIVASGDGPVSARIGW